MALCLAAGFDFVLPMILFPNIESREVPIGYLVDVA
jgi:hypothetical protein